MVNGVDAAVVLVLVVVPRGGVLQLVPLILLSLL
eukprot:CAMPEP_0196820864 /NCGR_PEP_ID=MMETSP1362-20130617/76899_1 /TAXON_ID=163516 /ORGANISM="Leptocylindrus danicus, Strain CCMP1856" /LENGTH=33 /DNA_ID= /DNA_START= /DNA_END= /DNA_ORIENTATION=